MITAKGLQINAQLNGNVLVYSVVEQSAEFTQKLAGMRGNWPRVNGFLLGTNKYPSYNHASKEFWLRGHDASKNDKIVIANFRSKDEAKAALAALEQLVKAVYGHVVTAANAANAVQIVADVFDRAERQGCLKEVWRLVSSLRGPDVGNAEAKKRFTTKVRHALITAAQAKTLRLSDNDEYPPYRQWKKATAPALENEHLNEHIGQAFEVLNTGTRG